MNTNVATIGFLKADRRRLRILEALRSKANPQSISHKLRISRPMVEKSITELSERGLVKKEKDAYIATEEGLKVLAQISRAGM